MQLWSGILTVALGVLAILGAWAECIRPSTTPYTLPGGLWKRMVGEVVHFLHRITVAGWLVLFGSIALTVIATQLASRAEAENERRTDSLIAAQMRLLNFRKAEAWRDIQLTRVSHRAASMCQFDLAFQHIEQFLADQKANRQQSDAGMFDEAIIGLSLTMQMAEKNWRDLLEEFRNAEYSNDEPQDGDLLIQLESAIQRFEVYYCDLNAVIKDNGSVTKIDDAALGALSARLAWIGLEVGAANCEAGGLARVIIEREFSHRLSDASEPD